MKRKVLFLFSLLVAFATTLAAKTVPNAGLISSKWEKVCDNYGIWDLVDGVYIYHKSVRTRVPGDKIRCKFKSDGPVTFRLSTKRDVNYMGRLYIVAGRMDTSCNETTTDLEATTIDANDEPITVTYYPTDTEEHSVEFVICTTSPFMDVGQSTCSVMLEKHQSLILNTAMSLMISCRWRTRPFRWLPVATIPERLTSRLQSLLTSMRK